MHRTVKTLASDHRRRDYYQLKGNLVDVQLEEESSRLVLVFEKRSDPGYSANRIRDLEGFVICSIKKVLGKDQEVAGVQSSQSQL
jgi:hypothetical protein